MYDVASNTALGTEMEKVKERMTRASDSLVDETVLYGVGPKEQTICYKNVVQGEIYSLTLI